VVFEKETNERAEETSPSKRIGVVNHKVALAGDFSGAKLHLFGVGDKKLVAE